MKKRSRKCLSVLLALTLLASTVPMAAQGSDLNQSSGKNDIATITTSDAAVESVQEMIDSLPTTDELAAMTKDEQTAVYTDLQAAYDAYNALMDGQKAEVTGAEMFDSLFEVLNSMTNALAADGDVTYSYCDDDGKNWTTGTKSAEEYTIFTTESEADLGGEEEKEYWYVVDETMRIDTVRFTVTGDVHLIIKEGCTLTLDQGIQVQDNDGDPSNGSKNCLSIYGPGTLTIGRTLQSVGVNDAAIGSNGSNTCGTITIYGGTINATNGRDAIVIGSGSGGHGGNITIHGGTISATSTWQTANKNHPAIGGSQSAGIIKITGGHVTVEGYGKGIGADNTNSDGQIIITGGYVKANGIGTDSWTSYVPTTIKGNAIVISTLSINENDKDNWQGVVFTNEPETTQGMNQGYVYGDVEIEQSFEIPANCTLTVPEGVTLTIPEGVTLTNNGKIVNNGSIAGGGKLTGSGQIEGSGSVTVADNDFKPEAAVSVTIGGEQVQDNTAPYGSTITLTATISEAEANALTRAAADQVEFFVGADNSKTSLGTVAVSNNVATKQITLTDENWKPDTYTITAEYGGSSSLKPASGTAQFTVTKAEQTGKPTVSVSGTAVDSITVSASGDGQGGYEYACVSGANASAPSEGWQSGTTFSDLTPGTAYTVFARFAGDEYYEPSPTSEGVTAYTVPTTPEASAVTINYMEETVSFDDTLEVNTSQNFDGTGIENGGSISEHIGASIYVRVKASGNTPASAAQKVNIPARPAAPSVSINYEEETLSTTTAMQYRLGTSGQKWEPCSNDMNAVAFDWDGTAEITVRFRTSATSSTFASAEQNLTVPVRPAAPAGLTAHKTSSVATDDGKITGLDNAKIYQYSTDGTNWAGVSAGSTEIVNLAASTYQVRFAAVDNSSFASSSTILTVQKPTTPIAPGDTVRYVVEHYKADTGSSTGYTLVDTEYLAGKIGETVTATPKDYDGYIYNAGKSTASGTLEAISSAEDIVTLTLYYDVSTTPVDPGNTVRYIVEHYVDNGIDYTLKETERPAGEIGKTVTAVPKNYEGYTYNAEKSTASGELKEIKGESDILTLKLYYDLTAFTVTVESDGNGSASASPASATMGTEVKLTAEPNAGYHFGRWEVVSGDVTIANNTFTMPAANVIVKAIFDRNSSGGGGTVTPSYTLTFDTNGGSALEPVKAKRGTTIDLTDYTPNRDGYTFNGWYADEDLSKQLTSITLNSNKTIYAGWTKNTVETLPFTDVDENDWFYNPVRWAFLEGLMTGTSDTEFSPNLATTRGMIVSVLYRLEGNPDLSDEILGYPYEDVDANAWYAMPVYWARLHGIVSGYSDNQFGPNDAITREQLAAILMNYATYKGMDVSARADLSNYSDADTISAWATDTMEWAVAEGYISGMTADTLAPQGSATRAQVASIFQRFLEGE